MRGSPARPSAGPCDLGGSCVIRIYTRVSTEEQATEGFSLDAQLRACRAFCEAQAVGDPGWVETRLYTDEGLSAKDTNRPGLQRLLSEVQSGDTLLVYKLDRLTRAIGDLDTLLKRSQAGGWNLRSVTESLDTSSATGRAMVHLIGVFAQWERETIAERMRMGKVQRALSGKRVGGHSNLGLKIVDGVAEVDQESAPLVQDIFRWYLHEQLGLFSIVTRLNRAGIASPTGGKWRTGTIYKILRNPIYAGDLRYGDVHLRGIFPALVDRSDWERVQQRLSRSGGWRSSKADRIPARARNSRYLLTGLVKCALCGSAMIGVPRGRRKKDGTQNTVYACTGYMQKRACPTRNEVRTERLDEKVVAVLGEVVTSGRTDGARVLLDDSVARRDLEVVESGFATIERKKARAWEAYLAGDISMEFWRETERSLAREREQLQEQAERLRNQVANGGMVLERAKRLAQSFAEVMLPEHVPVASKKAWLQEHVEVIRVRSEASWPAEVEITLS